jgi:hypothetical protein
MFKILEGPAEMAEQVYYDLTRPGRRLLQRGRWTLLPRSLATCMKCGALAQWRYAPSGPRMDYCDDCVPRGCSCNVIDHTLPAETIIDPPDANGVELVWTDYGGVEPEQHRDGRGRLLPCCEFEFDRWGWRQRPEK